MMVANLFFLMNEGIDELYFLKSYLVQNIKIKINYLKYAQGK